MKNTPGFTAAKITEAATLASLLVMGGSAIEQYTPDHHNANSHSILASTSEDSRAFLGSLLGIDDVQAAETENPDYDNVKNLLQTRNYEELRNSYSLKNLTIFGGNVIAELSNDQGIEFSVTLKESDIPQNFASYMHSKDMVLRLLEEGDMQQIVDTYTFIPTIYNYNTVGFQINMKWNKAKPVYENYLTLSRGEYDNIQAFRAKYTISVTPNN